VTLRCCVRRYRNVGSCSPNDKAPRHQAPVLSCTRQSEQNGDISAGALILNITFRSTMRTVRYVYRPVNCQVRVPPSELWGMCTAQWTVRYVYRPANCQVCVPPSELSGMCTAQWTVRYVYRPVNCQVCVPPSEVSGFMCFMASFVAFYCFQTHWNNAVHTQSNLWSAKTSRSLFVSDCYLTTRISCINSDISADEVSLTVWSVYGLGHTVPLIVCSNPVVCGGRNCFL